MNPIGNQIGPFMYCAPLMERVVDGTKFIIGIASAYNAFGLIGSEDNGVFVLDETNRNVVMDQGEIADSGWYGPTQQQETLQRALAVNMTDREFIDFLTRHPRFRSVGLPLLVS